MSLIMPSRLLKSTKKSSGSSRAKQVQRKLSKTLNVFGSVTPVDSEMDLRKERFLQIGSSTFKSSHHIQNEDRACFRVFNPRPPMKDGDELVDSEDTLSGFAAVLDGHGGNKCSDYVSKVLPRHLQENFEVEDAWMRGEEVLKEVFHNIDKEWCEIARYEREHSGACATIVLIKGNDVIIGNIGDCRAVLVPVTAGGSYGAPVEITVDHRADATAENLRINEAGGEVKDGRVFSLQPSRSFGDLDVKIMAGKDVVICSPDTDTVHIHSHDLTSPKAARPFMVIASDGVWDVLSNKEVAQCVKKWLKKEKRKNSKESKSSRSHEEKTSSSFCDDCDPDWIADNLVKLAKNKGSDDDITAIVVLF